MTQRVVVFLDYQNVFHRARSLFLDHWEPASRASIDPIRLGQHLAGLGDPRYGRRELAQVRVYRGVADSSRDPKTYGAARRQHAAWLVHLTTRPLRYPFGWPDRSRPGDRPQEKGIDVALALDLVLLAQQRRYDVAVLFTTDTDLRPAVEVVMVQRLAHVEVAAWTEPRHQDQRLSVHERRVWCHWLDREVFLRVRDDRDFSDSSADG
jgi:uncharacterized LabA/DUF88 family protein